MLEEQIKSDYIQAMKDKNSLKSSTLNFLRAQIKNIVIDKGLKTLDDQEVIAVIKKQIKQRQDSIEQYTKGGREDLAQKESSELDILKAYLPEEMGDDQLQQIVKDVISEVQPGSMKEMGKVMGAVMQKVAGQADNKRVSELVKQALSQL